MIARVDISSAGYTGSTGVLRNINMAIDPGRVILISGPSGSGKSTLIFTITGVLKHLLGGFVNGAIAIDDLDPLTIDGFERLPEKIGFLMQDPERQLIFPTPLDEISTSLEIHGLSREEAVERARSMLGSIGLGGKEEAHVEELSSGERRRLSIMLSIMHKPSLLILDEPSANLDPEGIAMVREIVRRHRENNGSVIITEHKTHYFKDLVDEAYILREGSMEKEYYEEEPIKNVECYEKHGGSNDRLLEISSGVVGYPGSIVLRDIDLHASRGEVVALVGPNGSGKTTLLKTIAGLIGLIDGHIKIHARRVFYAPQNPDLVFTEWSVERELKGLSRRAGIPLEQLVSSYPWYDQVRRLSPLSLSHGQRRLLELLIAFSFGRELLLLDEPTTGLDPHLYFTIVRWIRRHAEKGGSAIISTHDPRLVLDTATRVYRVSSGRVKEIDKCEAVEKMLRGAGVEV